MVPGARWSAGALAGGPPASSPARVPVGAAPARARLALGCAEEEPMTPIVPPELEQYAHDHTTPRPELFEELREQTYATMASPHMQVGRVEGTLLKMLCAISGARHVLEVGTFTGFSALCMAEALPEGGELLTCDINPEA